MSEKDKVCLNVAVVLPVRKTFDYRVPDHLVSTAEVGRRVLVPFRNRKVTGYILEKRSGNDDGSLKDIQDILDPEPLFHENLVPFFRWMADYYLYPIGRLIQSALPGGLNVTPIKTGRLTEKGLMALNSLPTHSEERKLLSWIMENPGKRLPSPNHLIHAFQKNGWVVIETMMNRKPVGPLMRKFVRVKNGVNLKSILREKAGTFRAKNEQEFLEILTVSGAILLTELSSRFHNGLYLVNKWIKKGLLESYRAPVFRNPAGGIIFPAPVPEQLYDQQVEVLGAIQESLEKEGFHPFLLHGVTGSGKTEVYYQAIKYANELGRQAILMVPEIALAVYMESIFRSRLDERIAIFHSGLSRGERYDQWVQMARGEVSLVIGARSALFAPFPRLGLIIVDEEYDTAYKQEEGLRYQARDAAVVRGKMEQAPVLLGSGTPSVQSFHNAAKGRYQLLSMPERIEKRPLPDVEIVDMKDFAKGGGEEAMISPTLKKAVEKNVEEGKQTILFLNRRGFDQVYFCRSCGHSLKCYNCDLALTHHLKENCLACHYCGFHLEPRKNCPSCGHEGLRPYGFGTEKLELELKELFPGRRVVRMDRDSTSRKGESSRILKRFTTHEIDILVGTQMITKGYDFPNVTLVGVIAADLSLWFPDFRAGERTFQLISQVSGRAGRGDQGGRVIVQTFNPEHYAITAARDHDYQNFFQREVELREQLGYPPFSYLACLRLQGNQQKATALMAQRLGQGMTASLEKWPKRGKEIQVLGPVEAPLGKLKGKYRWQILVKSRKAELLHYFLEKVEGLSRKMLRASGISLIIDVDPYQML